MSAGMRIIGLALTYVGAIIGAGFASGQEILYFFVRFGYWGLWGTAVAGLGFMLLGALFFRLAQEEEISSYHRLLPFLLGRTWGRIIAICLSLYLFSGLVIMLAGCGAVFWEYFHLPHGIGVLISALVLVAALLLKEEGVLAFNTLLVPLIILGALLISILTRYGVDPIPISPGETGGTGWLVSSLLYISYNMIGGMVILVRFTGSSLSVGVLGSWLGGAILGFLAWVLAGTLLVNYEMVKAVELPMLHLANRSSPLVGLIYAFVLWFAMLTSAVVDVAVLAHRFSQGYFSYFTWVAILLLVGGALTKVGFTVLIQTIYPFFGYIGLIVLAALLFRALSGRNRYG